MGWQQWAVVIIVAGCALHAFLGLTGIRRWLPKVLSTQEAGATHRCGCSGCPASKTGRTTGKGAVAPVRVLRRGQR